MKAAAAGFDVAIVTMDKDFYQLVGDRIKVYNPRDDGTWYDAEGVKEKFGVAPDHVVDVLALMGDTIDNIKGVPGVGEKGARELIVQLRIAREPARSRVGGEEQALPRRAAGEHGAGAPRAGSSPASTPTCRWNSRPRSCGIARDSREAAFAIFNELGFRTLAKEYAPTASTITKTYRTANTAESVQQLAGRLRAAGRFALRVAAGPAGRDAELDRRARVFHQSTRRRLRPDRATVRSATPSACRWTRPWPRSALSSKTRPSRKKATI